MFLRERLKALREGWAELQQMWENRQQLLTQSLELQLLQRDARQAEVLLSHQEHRSVAYLVACHILVPPSTILPY